LLKAKGFSAGPDARPTRRVSYMGAVSIDLVKALREKTGAGMMDCKSALEAKNGNMDEAIKWLREKGIAKAEARSSRATGQGVIASYIHPGDRLGTLLELNCETDFVSRTDEFKQLAKDICMQIAASAPLYVQREDVPAEVLTREKDIYKEQARQAKKPEAMLEKIAEGKLDKFYQEVCLLEQPFVKDPEKNIKALIAEFIAKTGENVKAKRFKRFVLGE
jgi:elongation factor Ts